MWQDIQRRLSLSLIGCALGIGGYLAAVRPATADTSLASGYEAVWAGRSSQAVQPILEALRLDAGSPERWADLAEVMHETGRDADTRYCLEQELSRAPGLPHVAMRAAGMYFRLGDAVAALRLTHGVLGETGDYDANVFQTWQRLGGTAANVFAWGVGSNTHAGRGYFRFLIDAGDDSATDAAWTELTKNGMASVDESRFYAESLAGRHEYGKAANIESAILPQGVWNGGFEEELTGRGLDWKAESIPGIAVSRDTSIHHGGSASLRLEFDGSGRNEFIHVFQTRVVPGGRWNLGAVLRTDTKATGTKETTGGIGLRIVDAGNGRVLAETARLSGTHGWTPVEASLDAGPRARAVRIEIVRPAVPPGENAMSGTAWVDDVTLSTGSATAHAGRVAIR